MGINCAPSVFQNIMNKVLTGIKNARVCSDDVLIATSGSCEEHLEEAEQVLKRPNDIGFHVNLKKSFFAVEEL